VAEIRLVIQTQGVTVALSSGNSGNSSITDSQYDRPITATDCDQTGKTDEQCETCLTATDRDQKMVKHQYDISVNATTTVKLTISTTYL
jgi:hypothetical protein